MSKLSEKVSSIILVRASRPKVFDALTTEKDLNAWFSSSSHFQPFPAGKIHFVWTDQGPSSFTGENGGTIVEFVPPRRLVFNWKTNAADYETTVEIDFKVTADGTLVTVAEEGFADTVSGLKDLVARASRWGQSLALLKFYVEHGVTY